MIVDDSRRKLAQLGPLSYHITSEGGYLRTEQDFETSPLQDIQTIGKYLKATKPGGNGEGEGKSPASEGAGK